jgi:4'-phosphopantetheinyl transferase
MISKPFDPGVWSMPPAIPTLPADTVHLWRLRLDRTFLRPLRETLAACEAVQAERLPTEIDRRRFISGCGQLREILGLYLGMPAEEVPLGYGLSGEPATIRSRHNLFFDFARAGHLGLLAVSHIHNVTVELESVCGDIPFELLADHFLEPRENWDVRTAPRLEQSKEFFRTWTGREAIRRAGEGSADMREVVPGEGFVAAVAAEGEDWKVDCWEW